MTMELLKQFDSMLLFEIILIKKGGAPSMFSCEDVETEWLKQSLK